MLCPSKVQSRFEQKNPFLEVLGKYYEMRSLFFERNWSIYDEPNTVILFLVNRCFSRKNVLIKSRNRNFYF